MRSASFIAMKAIHLCHHSYEQAYSVHMLDFGIACAFNYMTAEIVGRK
ncbi:hypothetical protein ccbrp13_25280 [Ktedonobacteria bacterium brp13]|nr:hypothetical protein ccbrp13_25280 [Ktedonobacteria bacterium brp13]